MNEEEFKHISNLKWHPWIGSEYFTSPNDKKLLIIGESHYHNNTPESIEQHNSKNFTREIIKELAIQRWYYSTRIFPNLHRAIFRNDDFNSFKFWNSIAFYNFIQRTMETNKGRPTREDFNIGWSTFFELVQILKPRYCLFIGTSAANFFNHSILESKFNSKGVNYDAFISNAYPRTAKIELGDDIIIDLIFIRHTSSMFSWSKWNEYLSQKIPHILDWLSEQVEK